MFFWNEQSIKWYQKAAEYSHYHERLAALLTPLIGSGETVCDLGCGLGYLSLELAKTARHVTAVDLDGGALDVLRQSVREKHISNLEILQSDSKLLLAERKWDTVVLCFFGGLTANGNYAAYLSRCAKRLIVITSGSVKSDIAPSGISRHGKERAPEIAAFLKRQGADFSMQQAELEFGQPLDSPEDAIEFVRHYAPECSHENAKAHVIAQLTRLPDGRYYLPNSKTCAIFIIHKGETM